MPTRGRKISRSRWEPIASNFVAELSHELRTALLNVSGHSELLLDSKNRPASDWKIVSAIHTNSRYVVDLLDSLLEMTRRDAGHATQPTLCSPRQIAKEVLNSFSLQASTKG